MKETVKWPTFPYSEYRARVERAKQCLEQHGLDAMLLFAPTHWHYYAGFTDAAQMHNEVWRSALIVPRDRDPVALIHVAFHGPRSTPRSTRTSRLPSTTSSSTRSAISAFRVGRWAWRRARRLTPTSPSRSSS